MSSQLVLLYRWPAYLAAALLVGGLGWRLFRLWRTPEPLRRPLCPAPRGRRDLALRLAGGACLGGLRRAGRIHALLAGVFHLSLLLVLLAHLRLVWTPAPAWTVALAGVGPWAGVALVSSCLGLLLRRVLKPELSLVSRSCDYLPLLGVLLVAAGGLFLCLVAPCDLAALKALLAGGPLPPGPPGGALLLHLYPALVLLAWLPFSPMFHALAWLFSPARHQRDLGRQVAHPNPWEPELAADAPSQAALEPGEPALWTLEEYRRHLKKRWYAQGTGQVLSSRQRRVTDLEAES